jgi:hypothetical protein
MWRPTTFSRSDSPALINTNSSACSRNRAVPAGAGGVTGSVAERNHQPPVRHGESLNGAAAVPVRHARLVVGRRHEDPPLAVSASAEPPPSTDQIPAVIRGLIVRELPP